MADTFNAKDASGTGVPVCTEEITTLNGATVTAQQLQRVALALTTGNGVGIDLPGDATNGLKADVSRVPADPFGATADAIVAAGATGSLSAKLRRATQGLEDLKSLIVLAAGTNNIGDVDVLTVPADPFGANADAAVAAGATGSISAKLRRATQGLEDLKTAIVLAAGSNTIGAVSPAVGGQFTGLSTFSNKFTTTQTSANLVAGTTGQRIYVPHLTISTGGTVAGRVSIYWGTGAFTAGTSITLFDGEFVPTANAAPGAVMAFAIPRGGASATGDNLRITTSAGITVYVTFDYWKA